MIHPETIKQLYCRQCNQELDGEVEHVYIPSFYVGIPDTNQYLYTVECPWCGLQLTGDKARHELEAAFLLDGHWFFDMAFMEGT